MTTAEAGLADLKHDAETRRSERAIEGSLPECLKTLPGVHETASCSGDGLETVVQLRGNV